MAMSPVARGTSAGVCHPHMRQAAERAGWRRGPAGVAPRRTHPKTPWRAEHLFAMEKKSRTGSCWESYSDFILFSQ